MDVLAAVLRGQDAALAHHADDAARREGAAAEAEEEKLVAGLVVADEEAVGVVNVVVEALADGAARDAIDRVARADALVVIDDLRHPGGIPLRHPVAEPDHVRRTGLVVGLLVGAVPGAVAAKDESFHEVPPTPR